MNTFDLQGGTSITCTCIHGGGGHMPACPMFVATREQYLEVANEREQLRQIAKAAKAMLDAYDRTGGLVATQAEAAALDTALDAIKVNNGITAVQDWPYWMRLP